MPENLLNRRADNRRPLLSTADASRERLNLADDAEVLREEGVTDFEQYATKPGAPLRPDLFLD